MSADKPQAAAGELPKKSRIPHIYVLLFGIILCCVLASWILPAGEFDRQPNAAGRMLVVPGTYHTVEANRIGLFQGLIDIYNGMVDAGGVVFFVFISYAAIGLIIKSGAFNGLVGSMLKRLTGNSKVMIIPLFMILVGSTSSTIGLFEETLPFIPIFVGIAMAMGYDAIVGMAIISLAAGIGYSGAAMNPFTVGIAQGIAEIQPMSGAGYRVFCHLAMVAVASIYTMRYALKVQKDPTKSLVHGDDFGDLRMDPEDLVKHPFGVREKLVLLVLVLGIGAIVAGSKLKGWYFPELCAVFLIMGLLSSAIMGWRPNDVATKVADSFAEIAMACLMIGLARGILVVLKDGKIIDTVVYGLSMPLSALPRWMAAEFMLVIQTLLNFLIPSGSGQAATSMPIMAPLSDLLGISRQVAVLAFQFGDGLSNILWPTAFMPVICGLAKIRIDKWLRWFVPLFGLLFLTQMGCIALALAINYQ